MKNALKGIAHGCGIIIVAYLAVLVADRYLKGDLRSVIVGLLSFGAYAAIKLLEPKPLTRSYSFAFLIGILGTLTLGSLYIPKQAPSSEWTFGHILISWITFGVLYLLVIVTKKVRSSKSPQS